MRVLLVILLTAPAGLAAQERLRPCSVEQAPAGGADSAVVYRDCDVERPARLRRDARPGYTFVGNQRCAVAVLEFVVDTTGVPDTTTARVFDTDTPEYAEGLLRSLPRWRYEPARRHGVAVRQVVRERRALEDRERVPFVARGAPVPPPPPPCR